MEASYFERVCDASLQKSAPEALCGFVIPCVLYPNMYIACLPVSRVLHFTVYIVKCLNVCTKQRCTNVSIFQMPRSERVGKAVFDAASSDIFHSLDVKSISPPP